MSLQSWTTRAFIKLEKTACLMALGLADQQQRYKAFCKWAEAVGALEAGQISEFEYWRERARAPGNNERYAKEEKDAVIASQRLENQWIKEMWALKKAQDASSILSSP